MTTPPHTHILDTCGASILEPSTLDLPPPPIQIMALLLNCCQAVLNILVSYCSWTPTRDLSCCFCFSPPKWPIMRGAEQGMKLLLLSHWLFASVRRLIFVCLSAGLLKKLQVYCQNNFVTIDLTFRETWIQIQDYFTLFIIAKCHSGGNRQPTVKGTILICRRRYTNFLRLIDWLID